MSYRSFNKSVQIYDTSGSIPVFSNCFAIMFTNIGDTIARVDDMVVFPNVNPATGLGDSRSWSGNMGDLYKAGKMVLKFDNPAGVNPQVEIVQLYYIDVATKLAGL